MIRLTKEEQNLVSLYRTGTRQELIEALDEMQKELAPDEIPLATLTQKTRSKLKQMTDAEFEALDIVPTFMKGVI